MRLKTLLLLGAAAVLSIGAHAADATRSFDIRAQDLATSLEAFSRQSDTEILFDRAQTQGVKAPAVTGDLPPQEALQRLLENSGLRPRRVNDATFVIERTVAAKRPTQTAQSTPSPAVGTVMDAPPLEMVVTAQRRAESVQDIPMSISVLSGTQLDAVRESDAGEMLNRVPGVLSFQGQSGNVVGVRGVTSFSGIYHGSSATAFYLDSLPFALIKSGFVPDVSIYDLDRIEVLRGPQGTLYGAGALNGVVRVLTRDPDTSTFDFKGRVFASNTQSGGGNYRGDMAVNIPIVTDRVGLRLTAGYQDMSGWLDRVRANGTIVERDVNSQKSTNIRGKLRFTPNDRLTVDLLGWHSNDRDAAHPYGFTWNRSYLPFADDPHTTKFNQAGAKIGYDFGVAALTSTTSYLKFDSTDVDEFSGTGLPLTTLSGSKIFTQELYLNSAQDDDWRWSVGGMYRNGKDNLIQTISFLTFPIDFSDSSEAGAVFGEVTRAMMDDRLEITGGLRYFFDHVGQRQNISLSGPGGPVANDDNKFDAVTPRATITFHAREDLTTYASYSQGFRSGFGQNPLVLLASPGLPAVSPDRLHNFEVGAKGALFDPRLSFDTSVYYIKWNDVIQDATVLLNGNPVAAVANASSASGLGVDFSLAFKPARGVDIAGYVSWNDLRDDERVTSAGLVTANEGDRLSYSPEVTAGVSVDYSFPIGAGDSTLTLSGSANYIAKAHFYNAGPVVAERREGQNVWTGRAGATLQPDEHWSITAFVENIGNTKRSVFPPIGVVGSNPFAPGDRIIRSRPRTVGLQAEYKLGG